MEKAGMMEEVEVDSKKDMVPTYTPIHYGTFLPR